MSILNIGARALMANQVVLQTTGNNIANVNTPGYSRQTAVMQTVEGQFTGSGYIGKGVDVVTIQRNYSAFLTRQSTLAGAVDAADNIRSSKLKLMGGIFEGGSGGLGAAINDMLNAFSDVASAPTDLTARTVALTRVSETASRMRASSQRLDDLQASTAQELSEKINAINTLSQNIADVNGQISKAKGTGQAPNDLLDKRDQLVRELNQYIQTSAVETADGGTNIYIGGSQAIVLGSTASVVKLTSDDFGDPLKSKLAIVRGGQNVVLDENTLGGGEVSGLLRFQNTDLVEGRNLLGRLTMAISTSMNEQHAKGLDLDGNAGGNLFTSISFANSIAQPSPPAKTNTGTFASNFTLTIKDVTKFAASDYEISFLTGSAGTVTRRSDGAVTAFDFATSGDNTIEIDGLTLTSDGTGATPGDRLLIKPFSASASNIAAEFSSPRALAVASPWSGLMGSTNAGSLQLATLQTRSNPFPADPLNPTPPVTLKFIGPNQYIRSDDANYPDATTSTAYNYVSGQAIESTLPVDTTVTPYTYPTPLTGWSVTLQGSPKAGDSYTIQTQPAAYRNLNAGNATAMMSLRDTAMFDGSALTDGYASLIAQLGIRSQSANYSAEVSSSIAANLEKDRTGASGVNLDEEASKLLQYQQAYQATAKLMQVAQGIFDTLMQTFR